jgi:chitinase
VPLEDLFPNPPTGPTVSTKFKLETDPTFGGHITQGTDNPNDAAFGFVVMASPQEIQVSLDRRDGSHWEVYDCLDAKTVGEHKVKMVCTDDSPQSNCHEIGLGHGVPGTILEMPDGCGPGRYAVAKEMSPAADQTLPKHLEKRLDPSLKAIVYDLTFDYDFARVPRGAGDTQIRIDYSNQKGYWNAIVDKAASKKRKRSLEVSAAALNTTYLMYLSTPR